MTRIEKVKSHFRNNKVTYIACGVTAVVVAGVTYYVTRSTGVVQKAIEIVGDTAVNNAPTIISSHNYKPTNIINNTIELVERSTPSKAVALLDTNGGIRDVFCSLNEAARKTGHHLSKISQNINHHVDSIGEDRFVLLSEIMDAA